MSAVVHFDEAFVAQTGAHRVGGIIIKLATDKDIVAGEGFHIEFVEHDRTKHAPEYLSIEEGSFDGDHWIMKCILNGDEESARFLPHQPRIVQIHLNRDAR